MSIIPAEIWISIVPLYIMVTLQETRGKNIDVLYAALAMIAFVLLIVGINGIVRQYKKRKSLRKK